MTDLDNQRGPTRCPVHGEPGDDGIGDWPCPVAFEDDPDGVETCPYFVAEMDRRVADMEAGNFWKMEKVEGQQHWLFTEYRGHQPTGRTERTPAGWDADTRRSLL